MRVSFGESVLLSVIGMVIVFVMLIAIMMVIMMVTRAIRGKGSEKTDEPVRSAAHPVTAPPVQAPVQAAASHQEAPGSAGEIKLYNVPDKQAAMVMAIVADHLKTPLNQLRFKSIKRID